MRGILHGIITDQFNILKKGKNEPMIAAVREHTVEDKCKVWQLLLKESDRQLANFSRLLCWSFPAQMQEKEKSLNADDMINMFFWSY